MFTVADPALWHACGTMRVKPTDVVCDGWRVILLLLLGAKRQDVVKRVQMINGLT